MACGYPLLLPRAQPSTVVVGVEWTRYLAGVLSLEHSIIGNIVLSYDTKDGQQAGLVEALKVSHLHAVEKRTMNNVE